MSEGTLIKSYTISSGESTLCQFMPTKVTSKISPNYNFNITASIKLGEYYHSKDVIIIITPIIARPPAGSDTAPVKFYTEISFTSSTQGYEDPKNLTEELYPDILVLFSPKGDTLNCYINYTKLFFVYTIVLRIDSPLDCTILETSKLLLFQNQVTVILNPERSLPIVPSVKYLLSKK